VRVWPDLGPSKSLWRLSVYLYVARPPTAPIAPNEGRHSVKDVVTVTTPSAWCEVGRRFFVVGSLTHSSGRASAFGDYLARLTLWQAGNPWHEGVTVKPSEGALPEAIARGLVHESLIEEPRAA